MEQWRGIGGGCSWRRIGCKFRAIVIWNLVLVQWTECSVAIVARYVSYLFSAQLLDKGQLSVGKTVLELIAAPFFDFWNYLQLYALDYHETCKVHGSNVQIISVSEMCASFSVHFVSKGQITDSRTVIFSRFSTERYVSLLFNVYWFYVWCIMCYVSLLFKLYWCYVSLLFNVYWCYASLLFNVYWCYVCLLFKVYLCYMSLLFNVYWCYGSLLFNVYWCCVCLLFDIYWYSVIGNVYFLYSFLSYQRRFVLVYNNSRLHEFKHADSILKYSTAQNCPPFPFSWLSVPYSSIPVPLGEFQFWGNVAETRLFQLLFRLPQPTSENFFLFYAR